MSAIPDAPRTVGVECPRCQTKVECTLKLTLSSPKPKPGDKPGVRVDVEGTVPDLADKMAAHYRQAHPNLITEMGRVGREAGRKFVQALTVDLRDQPS